jgi:hypothetical protein
MVRAYFAFLALSALIFAHRAFADRAIFDRTAADETLLPFVPLGLLVRPGATTLLAPPFRAAIVTMLNGSSFHAVSFAPPFSIRQMYPVYRLPNIRRCLLYVEICEEVKTDCG